MKKHSILIVDDIVANIDVLKCILKEDYIIKVATNGDIALKIALGLNTPDLILLDIMMPGMNGYEVCGYLKKNIRTQNVPVIFVTSKDHIDDERLGFEVGAVDYITKPINPAIVEARVKTHLALYDQKSLLKNEVKKQTQEIHDTRLEIIRRLGRAAEYKDNETGMHVMRMSHYSKSIALEAGLSEEEADLILNAAPMHDIGKIGIADGILLKSEKLDDQEWTIMRQHPNIGAEIIGIQSSVLLDTARTAALTHHEKWNGMGYPNGLKEDEIPLIGRIVAIADVFDALTSQRPYKSAWPVYDAKKLIMEEAGQHFDPELTSAFSKCYNHILETKKKFQD